MASPYHVHSYWPIGFGDLEYKFVLIGTVKKGEKCQVTDHIDKYSRGNEWLQKERKTNGTLAGEDHEDFWTR